jgi:glycolate oxidase iron-sulfur subunit
VTQPDMANQIMEHKMSHAQATDAHYLVTSNPGCVLQMKLGIEKHAGNSPRSNKNYDTEASFS